MYCSLLIVFLFVQNAIKPVLSVCKNPRFIMCAQLDLCDQGDFLSSSARTAMKTAAASWAHRLLQSAAPSLLPASSKYRHSLLSLAHLLTAPGSSRSAQISEWLHPPGKSHTIWPALRATTKARASRDSQSHSGLVPGHLPSYVAITKQGTESPMD